MSSFTKPLTTTYLGNGFRRVEREFEYHVGTKKGKEVICVPKGFKTDFASIPFPASILIPKDGDHNQAAVLHDYLYSLCGKLPSKFYARAECDTIFLQAMKVLSVSWWKRKTMYRAVRMFGWIPWKNKK